MNTLSKSVEVYDPLTQSITNILAPELAPEFAPRERAQAQQVMERPEETHPQRSTEWEEGVQLDENPQGEEILWTHLSAVHAGLVERWNLTGSQRQALLRLLLQCSLTPHADAGETVDTAGLLPGLTGEAIAAFYGEPTPIVDADREADGELTDPLGETPLPSKSLQDAEVRDQLRNAKIVFGVDSSMGDWSFFYGKNSLADVILSGHPSDEQVISFLYDGRTDELEWLYAAVRTLKGSCCYELPNQE